ncbi:hypothetical protein YH63_018510 [Afipia massiliensis]|uniref:DUF4062 domain-containing protein n=1 Tax=Afipia massiliensis TaxID=211460 RepID=A0A4V6BEC2_9BRAD|nr:hypothetical protein [Afipia massiliensis]TKT73253.1 hypothetical protein YH63_018510 [Afipia massiliensis]
MRNITEYRLVIASPSDVFEERKAVFEAIAELNMQLEGSNISVRAIGWEESVSPGIGTEPQAVINKQLFQSYDMLIAVFGAKLGTPTKSFRSGSIEEIEKAIAATESVFEDQRIQIYFKDSIPALSKIDAGELADVLAFRSQLGEQGILYSTFLEPGELSKAVRINVQRAVMKLLNSAKEVQNTSAPALTSIELTNFDEPDEPGFLDLMEASERAVAEMTRELEGLSKIVDEIGNEATKQTATFEQLNAADVSTTVKKSSANDFAAFLVTNAQQLLDRSSRARILFRNLFEAQTELQLIILGNLKEEELAKAKHAMTQGFSEMLTNAIGTRDTMIAFKQTVEALPRITSQFNRAKKRLVEAITENIDYLNDVERGTLKLIFD